MPTTQTGVEGQGPDVALERARLKAIEEKVQLYSSAIKSVRDQSEKFARMAPKIAGLERDRIIQEENYKLLKAASDKARLDVVFDTSKVPNISVVQEPALSKVQADTMRKVAIGISLGGFVIGIALIFLIEVLLNRTVRRPMEIETHVGIPLWLSIPHVSRKSLRSPARKELANGQKPGDTNDAQVASWDTGHFIRPFAESIRDRLVLFFEQNGLTRKPKLVGVTGWSDGAGTSTLASGLAAALSETGDGKVLLVDMNVRNTEVHGFFDGKPASQLLDALKGADNMESAASNLYLATATQNDSGTTLLFPKRFYDLMPRFQASDFDYIIFDMPPMKDSNVTLAMAGFMDKMLMVVEADRNNIVPLKRACSELTAAKAKIAGVLNKTRTYGPKWLQAEMC
jgi:polysaccharide biosynthesis transport protein